MSDRILGLTLWRPWPWAILVASKRVENRPWWRPSLAGQWIALHAGKHWDYDGQKFIKRIAPNLPGSSDDHPLGIVGMARIGGVCEDLVEISPDQCKWFFGPYGWEIDEIVALPKPIPCKGAQGLWPLPPDVLEEVRAARHREDGRDGDCDRARRN